MMYGTTLSPVMGHEASARYNPTPKELREKKQEADIQKRIMDAVNQRKTPTSMCEDNIRYLVEQRVCARREVDDARNRLNNCRNQLAAIEQRLYDEREKYKDIVSTVLDQYR